MRQILIILILVASCAAAEYAVTPETTGLIAEHGAQHVYVLQGGVYDSILLRTRFVGTEQNPTVIRAAKPGAAFIQPKTPYLCGVYSADDMPPEWLIVEGLDVSGASVDGIRFVGGKHVIIRNCRSHDNLNNGLALHRNTDALVEGCTFDHNGDKENPTQKHGLYASGARVTVRDCTASHNTGWGLCLWDSARASVVSDNVCYANGGCGIVVQATEGARPADGNLISGNLLFSNRIGLQLSRGLFDRIIDNRIWDNREASITFQRESVGPVFLSGNKLDVPAVGGNGFETVATRPAEDN